jgi:hypothetical protein
MCRGRRRRPLRRAVVRDMLAGPRMWMQVYPRCGLHDDPETASGHSLGHDNVPVADEQFLVEQADAHRGLRTAAVGVEAERAGGPVVEDPV